MKRAALIAFGNRIATGSCHWPETCTPGAALAEFRADSLIVRCLPTRTAVLAMAAKYQRARSFSTPSITQMSMAALLKRPPDADARMAFLADPEDSK